MTRPFGTRRPLVCVTGMGIATSLGTDKRRNWEMLTQGRSGIRTIRRFETKGLQTTIGATIDADGLGDLPFPMRTEQLAERVLDEALEQAKLPMKTFPLRYLRACRPSK
jgi:3-oxoacyl-[acyl-carrier-protein] synthase II